MYSVNYFKVKELLNDNGIFLNVDVNAERFNSESLIHFNDNMKLESATGILSGNHMPTEMGFGSYTWSHLDPIIHVGRYCSIAGGVRVIGGNHPIDSVTSSPLMYDPNLCIVDYIIKNSSDFTFRHHTYYQKPWCINICNDVWIGGDVTLARSLTIGTGAVVAANSVVVKDVPPYAIVGGNPAQIIKYRFKEDIINQLLSSEWWNYDIGQISQLGMTDPVNFLENFYRNRSGLKRLNPKLICADDLKAFLN